MKYVVILVSLVIAGIRFWPRFPAHGVSWEGTYEAFAHLSVAAMFACPILYWILGRLYVAAGGRPIERYHCHENCGCMWIDNHDEGRFPCTAIAGGSMSMVPGCHSCGRCENDGIGRMRLEHVDFFRIYDSTAWLSLICGIILTFQVEAACFFLEVPFPFTK